MRIRFGFELAYSCEGPASMVLALSPTPGDGQRLLKRSVIQTEPKVRLHPFKDDFGNVLHAAGSAARADRHLSRWPAA